MIRFKNGHPDDGSDIPDGEYYTVPEFAAKYDVPDATVRIWVNRGQLSCEHYYGRVFIPEGAQIGYRRPWSKRRRELGKLKSYTQIRAQIWKKCEKFV